MFSSTFKKLMANVALAVMLTGMIAPIQAMALNNMGNLTIHVSPAQGTYQVLGTTSVALSTRTGNSSVDLQAGHYTVVYDDIPDYNQKPADQDFDLTDGGNVSLEGDYQNVTAIGTVNVSVSPDQGQYEIDGVAGVAVPQRTGSGSFDLQYGAYTVHFTKDIGNGYTIPDSQKDQDFTLSDQNKVVNIAGNYVQETGTGALTVIVNPSSGSYSVKNEVTGQEVVPTTVGTTSVDLAYGNYIVNFKPLAGFIPPADQDFTLSSSDRSKTITGNYTTQAGTGFIVVNAVDQDNKPITDGKWEIHSCTGNTLDSCNTVIANNTQGITLPNIPQGSYGIFADLTPAYSGRVILSGNPQILTATNTIYFNIQYTSKSAASQMAGIQATTQPVAGSILIDGQPIGTPTAAGAFIPNPAYQVDVTKAHTISFGSVPGYNSPAPIAIAAASLAAGATQQYTGTYSSITANQGTVTVNQNVAGGTVNLAGPSPFAVTAQSYSNANSSYGDYTLSSIVAPAGYALASVTAADGTTLLDASKNYLQTLSANTPSITFNVSYTPVASNKGKIQINVKDDAGADVPNGDWTLKTDAGTVVQTGATTTAQPLSVDPGNYAVTATIPAALQATYHDVTVTPATVQPLAANQTLTFDILYIKIAKAVTVTKQIVKETAMSSNNKRVSYSITLTNNSTLAINTVSVSDTMTGKSKLAATAGELDYVPGTFNCSGTCSSASPDGLAVQAVTVSLNANGGTATLTYDMTSNNAGQTAQAQFSNTVTASYTNPASNLAETATATANETVDAPAAIVTPVITSGGGGGGGGSGGGYSLVKGDMNLTIKKMVSLDGVNYQTPDSDTFALAIPEKQTTRVYTKVTLTNPGTVSAQNIRLKPLFDQGKSDITAGPIENLQGAVLDIFGRIEVDKVMANSSTTFTYSLLANESGQNVNPATEGFEVDVINSALTPNQDGLTYKNLGQKVVTLLYAGSIPANPDSSASQSFSNASGVLDIQVSSDKTQASVGDVVNTTLTFKNASAQDLTDLYLTYDYPAELNIQNAGGGSDNGRQILWQAPLLRPGEQLTKQIAAKVMAGSPGDKLRSLTSAMVNESENIDPVESILTIVGGAQNPVAKAYRLAQTGPASLLGILLFSILAALAYQTYGKRRIANLKAAALKPL
jgi:Domain of unknown function DUF11